MKKIRGDAAEHKLPPQARDELAALVTANAPLKTIQALFDRHGVDLSLQGAARAHHRVKAAADRLLARSATLHAVRKLAEKQGITLTGAALEQATVAVGDLLDASVDPGSEEGQQLLLKGLTALTGARSVEIQAERVGVAKGVTIHPVRVLGCTGSGTNSVTIGPNAPPNPSDGDTWIDTDGWIESYWFADIIEGVDEGYWISTQPMPSSTGFLTYGSYNLVWTDSDVVYYLIWTPTT
jgi:hypothetical protein